MKSINLEEKMEIIHHQMNKHKQIKGSILIRDNGLHISSKLPEKSESRKISTYIATIFRHINKKIRSDEVKIRLENGVNLFIKQIPNKKILLTTITDNAATQNMKKLMDRYSRKFHNIFS